jgi:hypothetical protein
MSKPTRGEMTMSDLTYVKASKSRWTTGKIVTAVGGGIVATIGVVVLLAGLALVVAHSEGRDGDGYYSSGETRLSTSTYALSAEDVDLGNDAADVVPKDVLGTVRVRAQRPDGGRVFVGIGPERQVRAYLRGVARAEVDDVAADPPTYVSHQGGPPARPPAAERFWVAQSQGSGRQTVDWEVDGGHWAIVAMNEDGARRVTVDADIGAKVGWLWPVGIALAGVGLLLGAAGAALIALVARRRRSRTVSL